MNAEKVAEFFLKAYLNRPFNYKNTSEAVYFHCFLTGKPYREALRIIEQVESIPSSETTDMTIATEQIGSEIASITDEEELIRYTASHRYEENEQHQTVVSKITDLLQSCYTLATKETEYTKEKAAVVTSSDALLDVIYDYDAYAMGKEKRTIAKSKLPKAIKENLPDRERLAKILRHEAKNDDVYRKALVLLTFYNFYAAAYLSQRAYRAESDIDLLGYADDFEAELEGSLFECGYVQLYKRNPFDWLILYCASFPNPLNQFRNVIDEYYLATGDDE